MKLTPLDIHHKEFGHSFKGYSEEQVDAFLDEVADEFERLFKENIDMNEKLEAANERVRSYQAIEASINATLLQAQRSSEEIVNKAGNEADSVLRDAELKAKEIIHNALQKKQTIANELIRIKQAEEDFRARYKSLLEGKLRDVDSVRLPDDVNVLLGDTDGGVVGDVAVRPASQPFFAAPAPAAPAAAPAPMEAPAPEMPAPFEMAAPVAGPVLGFESDEAQPGVEPQLVEPVGTLEQATMAMPPVEPPASGFVQSVSLGELGTPELEPEMELIEPGEFNLPGFDAFGEREDDGDIEEID